MAHLVQDTCVYQSNPEVVRLRVRVDDKTIDARITRQALEDAARLTNASPAALVRAAREFSEIIAAAVERHYRAGTTDIDGLITITTRDRLR